MAEVGNGDLLIHDSLVEDSWRSWRKIRSSSGQTCCWRSGCCVKVFGKVVVVCW